MVQQTKPFGSDNFIADPWGKLDHRNSGQMVDVSEKRRRRKTDYQYSRNYFRLGFRLDRPGLGAVVQKTFVTIVFIPSQEEKVAVFTNGIQKAYT